MADKTETFRASDENEYEVAIRGNLYVVKRDGEVFVTGSVPTSTTPGVSDEFAAFQFARNDVERKLKADKR